MAFEEALRLLAEHRAKAEQVEAEEARANGFSTYEEYWENRVEASRMEQLERDKELETRAMQMGMTLEQLEFTMEMEDPQRWVPRGWNLMARPPPCDCKGMTTRSFDFLHLTSLRSSQRNLLSRGVGLPYHSRRWGADRNAGPPKGHRDRRPAHRRRRRFPTPWSGYAREGLGSVLPTPPLPYFILGPRRPGGERVSHLDLSLPFFFPFSFLFASTSKYDRPNFRHHCPQHKCQCPIQIFA